MKARVLDARDLFPDEQVMWKTAEDHPLVPGWYVTDLMFKLQGVRDELEQIKSGRNFSARVLLSGRLLEEKSIQS
jgi:hypothetical protein